MVIARVIARLRDRGQGIRGRVRVRGVGNSVRESERRASFKEFIALCNNKFIAVCGTT